jgi:hypothetical protein
VAYCGIPHVSRDINGTWVRHFLAGQERHQWIRMVQYVRRFCTAFSAGRWEEAAEAMNQETAIRRAMTPEVLDAIGVRFGRCRPGHGDAARALRGLAAAAVSGLWGAQRRSGRFARIGKPFLQNEVKQHYWMWDPTWMACSSAPGRVVAGETDATAPVGPLLFSENGIADGGEAPIQHRSGFKTLDHVQGQGAA